jgi:sigma-B regulation protein RsbQ
MNKILFAIIFLAITSCQQKNNTMKEIKRDSAVINYRISGSGDTTLLFVHGSYIDQTYWNKQVKYFEPYFKVVTLDLPGHGLSGKERNEWSTQGFADDITTLINELALKNVVLVGHSWGADVNLIAATKNPKSIIGFVAIDYYKNAATLSIPQQQIDTIKANLKKKFVATNESYARMALLTSKTASPIVERVIKDFGNAYEPMGQQVTPEIFEMYKIQKDLLPKLKLKLYLINVDYIPTNEQPLKQYCVNGYEVLHINGTCHFPMLETPQELNKKIDQVIKEISATK